jgi:nitroreductase / dihydropteridine reductase
MDIIKQLEWRYATKKFDADKKVSAQDLQTVLQSLRLAASSYGLQPWKFVLVNNAEVRNRLLEHSMNQNQVVDASHLIVLCRKTKLTEADVDSYVEDTANTRGVELSSLEAYSGMMKESIKSKDESAMQIWMEKQIYIALGTVLTTCAAIGIDSCPMEGFDRANYNRILGLTEKGLTSVVLCPIGYRSADDKYGDAKKVRFSLDQLIVNVD